MRGTFVFEDPNNVVSRSEACNFVLSSKTVTCDFSMVRYLVRFIWSGRLTCSNILKRWFLGERKWRRRQTLETIPWNGRSLGTWAKVKLLVKKGAQRGPRSRLAQALACPKTITTRGLSHTIGLARDGLTA
jgi:hypothetical protein